MAISMKYLAPYNGPAAYSDSSTYSSTNSKAVFARKENPRICGFGMYKSSKRRGKRGMR